MKKSHLLLLLIPIGFSCSSSFKSLQTPDDVYYSPTYLRTENVRKDNQQTQPPQNQTVIVSSGTYHNDYDDYYYYGRRRHTYYNNGYNQPVKNVVVSPRTSNLNTYNHTPQPVNPKLIIVQGATEKTSTGAPVRQFKPAGTKVGNVMRAIVSGSRSISTHTSTPVSGGSAKASTTSKSTSSSRSFGGKK